MSKILIKNGLIIDSASGIEKKGHVYLENSKIIGLFQEIESFHADIEIDAENKVVCAGFIDLSVRLRDMGHSFKATVASETKAALSAGITTICLQPDTQPVIDSTAIVEQIKELAKKAHYANVLPIAALTQKLEGAELSNLFGLKKAGCIAASQANKPIKNLLVLRRAMEYAATHNLLFIYRPNEYSLSNNGCMHEGEIASRYGLPSIPEAAETIALSQVLELAEITGCRVHFGQLSCKRSIIKIYQARKYGLNVTADVAIHQLHLTEKDIIPFDSHYHVLPPFRTQTDLEYLRQGLIDGTLSAICSDHQPHDLDAKLGAFPETDAGISALETLLPLTLKLVEDNVLTLPQAIALLTCKPANILGLETGSLAVGKMADICIFDANLTWKIDETTWQSQGKNTPFWHHALKGRVTHIIQNGKLVYQL